MNQSRNILLSNEKHVPITRINMSLNIINFSFLEIKISEKKSIIYKFLLPFTNVKPIKINNILHLFNLTYIDI